MASVRSVWLVAAVALWGCGGDEVVKRPGSPDAGTSACAPPNRLVGEACREPGVQDDGCAAGTLGLGDGLCLPAGVAPEMCGDGFVHDGDAGCDPILPAEACAPGWIAVPGDQECRPVLPCAPGKWGDIAIDDTTQHVDQSYGGADSDGSAAKPWTTIGDAIAAADAGATIAVAAGSYAEDVLVQGKPVVLQGVCPEDVEIAGTGAAVAAVTIYDGAAGAIVRGVAVTGAAVGIFLSGSDRVLLDALWVHDNAGRGINVQRTLGVTSVTLGRSLVERNQLTGVFVAGSEASIESTAVRDTLPDGDAEGRGIDFETDTGDPSDGVVRGSLVEESREVGVFVAGSKATIESTVVRGTLPDAPGSRGMGLVARATTNGTPSTAVVRGSVLEDNRALGMHVVGSDITIEGTVVRRTLPDAEGYFGRGINVEHHAKTGAEATATIRSSLVEDSGEIGVFVMGSTASIEASVVRRTKPDVDGLGGRGINLQSGVDGGPAGTLVLRGSIVEQSHEVAVTTISTATTIEGTVVRGTVPNGLGLYGDGICAASGEAVGSATVRATVVEDAARAGLSNFGAATTLENIVVRCAAFELEGEVHYDRPFVFEDVGGNVCGCPVADSTCLLVSLGFQPPEPVANVE